MIRYAIVGAGWISQEAFMPAAAQAEHACMTAIVSGNVERAQKLAEFYSIKHVVGYEDYDALVQSDTIDAVYIAVPNPLHADFAIRAARNGKHVLVEKPIAATVEDAEAMVAAARLGGVLLMTSYRLHHEPGTIAALDAVRSGRIGEPKYFSAIFSFQSTLGNHRLNASNWGGPLQDIGIYCVNAVRHIFAAEPLEASAMAVSPSGDARFKAIDESLAVTLRFPGDRLAQFYCSFGGSELDMYRVLGSEGNLTMEPGFRFERPTQMRIDGKGRSEIAQFPHYDHFGGEIAYFSDCILKGTPLEPDGEEGLADLRVLLAIEKAAQTGDRQTISSPPRPRHPTADMIRSVPLAVKRLVL